MLVFLYLWIVLLLVRNVPGRLPCHDSIEPKASRAKTDQLWPVTKNLKNSQIHLLKKERKYGSRFRDRRERPFHVEFRHGSKYFDEKLNYIEKNKTLPNDPPTLYTT